MEQRCILKLFVVGKTLQKNEALIQELKKALEGEFSMNYELQIIDIFETPELALEEEVLATPTILKTIPKPIERILGDVKNITKVLVSLKLRES